MRRAVLVTRPEPGLSETVQAVQSRGWRAVACPVMRMAHRPPIADRPCRVMLVTSSQALPFLAHQDRDRLLLTVGSRTAERAEAMGFRHVEAASGTQEGLETLCRQKGLSGPDLMLACGRGRHGQRYGADLAESLGAQWVEAYQVQPMSCLSDAALVALAEEQVEAVLFYSSETVSLFMELCPLDQREALMRCRAVCLSQAIAERVEGFHTWGVVEVGEPSALPGMISE
ncbi:uroporphyrinogen-III synthase [Bombella sp. TMW 2.2559]|uniref:Uroporphyrinogen-III synthase n=1 Tax=Bombella dulcis TaxID=2967339 RepID=A0ABT3WA92_9PROT|nr:uroporphyrinogen-III synthase [Bombella dulcis]MCX5615558.1 uroporphyrinogen-III synthase [Bombella dulcis]